MTDWHPDPTWIRDRRVQYETDGLDIDDLAADPMAQWQRWHDEAFAAGVAEPNAMVLSTVDGDGQPDSRVLLVRGADQRGFTVFTNYRSTKSGQLEQHPVGAGLFAWLDLHRQVRVRGRVIRISDADSDAYFASRPRGSQIGAWASPQSSVIDGREILEQRVADAERRFHGIDVPRPVHWGGWCLEPTEFEFWQGRPNRLHDRLRYRYGAGSWIIERLAP
jgi:pyridoxamine 5'-phosphate oxidase